MTYNGIQYTFRSQSNCLQVEHLGPEGLPCGDGWVYLDRVVGQVPAPVVEVARKVLEVLPSV